MPFQKDMGFVTESEVFVWEYIIIFLPYSFLSLPFLESFEHASRNNDMRHNACIIFSAKTMVKDVDFLLQVHILGKRRRFIALNATIFSQKPEQQ